MPRRRTATQVVEETLPKCERFPYRWITQPYRRFNHPYHGRCYILVDRYGTIHRFSTLKEVARFLVLISKGDCSEQFAYDRARGTHWEAYWYSDWSFDYDRR